MGRHIDLDDDGIADAAEFTPPDDWSPCENRADPDSWEDPDIIDEPWEPAP